MQSSVITRRDEDEEAGPIRIISNQIASLTQGKSLEIENFKLSAEKTENGGITLEFAFRATVRFGEKSGP